MIIDSGALDPAQGIGAQSELETLVFGRCFNKNDDGWFSGRRGFKNLSLLVIAGIGIAAVVTGGAAGVVLGVGAVLIGAFRETLDTNTPDCPDPPEPDPAPNVPVGGVTGMGAAPPPGGNGAGNAANDGTSNTNIHTAGFSQQAGRTIIKLFSGGVPMPFSAMTDAGGYFFIPMIPEDEQFTAVAIDTVTGDTRTFTGFGPAIGDSILMFFDFINDDNSGATPINIGDVVNGEISTAGELDLYSFTAQAGQTVFFDNQGHSGISQVDWQVIDQFGNVVFNTCLGCGDVGVRTLSQGGTYILTVGDLNGNSSQTGTYQFQILDVPPPDEFALNIGDAVSDGVPGAGAGNIESPGVKDIYTFTATPGQTVFFDNQGHSGISQVNWKVEDEDGTVIFDTCLGCGDVGVRTLTRGGTYTIIVGDDRDDGVGTYQFQVWEVSPADEFALNIGDAVSDGAPGAGAGNIESPGVKDIYTFTATPGQTVFFDNQGQSGISQVNWKVEDEDGTVIFDACLGCGEVGVRTLTRGGTYTIIVGDDRDDGVGTYQFQVWDVAPADEFALNISDVVSDGVPGAGAGNIESPGVKDIYTFTATPGQTVFFDNQGQSGISQVNWKVEDEDGTVIFDACLGCGDPGARTLTRGGTYTITVGDDRDDGVGTYQFQITSQ